MTLTPEQRAAAIEAMALAIINFSRDSDGYAPLKYIPAGAIGFVRANHEAAVALDAALPIIAAAIVSDKPRDTNGEKP